MADALRARAARFLWRAGDLEPGSKGHQRLLQAASDLKDLAKRLDQRLAKAKRLRELGLLDGPDLDDEPPAWRRDQNA